VISLKNPNSDWTIPHNSAISREIYEQKKDEIENGFLLSFTDSGYYFHWGPDDVLSLPHFEREKFCREVSRINRETSGAEKNLFEV